MKLNLEQPLHKTSKEIIEEEIIILEECSKTIVEKDMQSPYLDKVTCKIYNKNFRNENTLRSHSVEHGEMITCEICKEKFSCRSIIF